MRTIFMYVYVLQRNRHSQQHDGDHFSDAVAASNTISFDNLAM